MGKLHHKRTILVASIALLTTLAGEVAQAQRLSCTGTEFFRTDSSGHVAAFDLARSSAGAWSLVHARMDRTAANRAKSVSLQDDSLHVVFEDIPAEYHGTVRQNETAVLGEWVAHGV